MLALEMAAKEVGGDADGPSARLGVQRDEIKDTAPLLYMASRSAEWLAVS